MYTLFSALALLSGRSSWIPSLPSNTPPCPIGVYLVRLVVLLARYKPERTLRRLNYHGSRSAGIIDELVQLDFRDRPHAHRRVVEEFQIRDTRVSGPHHFVGIETGALCNGLSF